MKNPYEVLFGAGWTQATCHLFTAEDIKAAYRVAASAAHPDKHGGDGRRMQEVNDAYALLSDPERRKQFDETGSTEPIAASDEEQHRMELLRRFKDELAADTQADLAGIPSSRPPMLLRVTNKITREIREHESKLLIVQKVLAVLERKLERRDILKRDGSKQPDLYEMLLETEIKAAKDGIEEITKVIGHLTELREYAETHYVSGVVVPPDISSTVGAAQVYLSVPLSFTSL